MNLGLFTYITGVAALLGLIIQFTDIFPKHRESKKNVLFIVLGLFIGTLIGSLQKTNISLAVPLTGIYLLVGAIIVVIFIILISAIFTSDNDKRLQLFGASGAGTAFLFIILFGYFLQSDGSSRTYDKVTNDELLILSEINKEKGNIERSIYFLEKVKFRLDSSDLRYKELEKNISELKKDQMKR